MHPAPSLCARGRRSGGGGHAPSCVYVSAYSPDLRRPSLLSNTLRPATAGFHTLRSREAAARPVPWRPQARADTGAPRSRAQDARSSFLVIGGTDWIRRTLLKSSCRRARLPAASKSGLDDRRMSGRRRRGRAVGGAPEPGVEPALKAYDVLVALLRHRPQCRSEGLACTRHLAHSPARPRCNSVRHSPPGIERCPPASMTVPQRRASATIRASVFGPG